MGYIRHHAVVVTTNTPERAERARQKAIEIFGNEQVTAIMISGINACYSFFIGPDGSKEGWPESDNGDKCRDEFVSYLESLQYDDGSSSIRYAELFYGDDEGDAGITRHN